MPFWKIYHPKGAYSPEDKQLLAQSLTDIYAPYMPRFYVNILFEEVDGTSFYIGGEPHGRFVRIVIDHIARTMDDELVVRFINRVNQVIAPWVHERGFDWELHVDETPMNMWSVQGYFPPPQGSVDDARWTAENRPSPRTHP